MAKTEMTGAGDLGAAFEGKRALVTGGLGFIGSNLGARLVELGAEVVLIDAAMPESGANRFNIAPIRDRIQLFEIDVRDTEKLKPHLAGCRYLFNLAGQSSHMESMRDPLADLDINARAQLALLEACRALCPEAAIVYAGTRQIYGRPRALPVDESHPLRPVDVNGVNKMAGEAFHLLFHDVYGLKAGSLRLTNTYGPRMRIKDGRQTFVGLWLRRLLEGAEFEVWGGAQLRDLTYAEDAVEALLLAAITPGVAGQALNVGGDGAVTLKALAQTLIAVHGGGRFVEREFPAERKRIDIGDYYADDARFRRLTGWAPKVPLAEGLARSLAYFRRHLAEYV